MTDGRVGASPPHDVRVGLCGWTTAMSTYFERFPVVEVQHTFYEPPSDTVLRRWRASAPTRFEFTIKAWQLVTHDPSSPTYRRMKRPPDEATRSELGAFRTTAPVMAAWERTLECARLLRATAILLQCPRSFRPSPANVAKLGEFLRTCERGDVRLMWEPRGEWPDALLTELCAEFDLVHVVDPMQRETVTPETTYYRLHGTTGARHVHSDDELARLVGLIDGRSRPYVMFNNLPRVGDASRFMAMLRRR